MARLSSTFAVALLSATVAAAQPPPFRSSVDVVLVDLTLLEPKDDPVAGLQVTTSTASSPAAPAPRSPTEPAVQLAVRKMAEYVATYGANASLFVASERYDQRIDLGPGALRPHTLESEFAIVRTQETVGWVGFRDVVRADGKQVVDRRDRLQALLTGPGDPRGEVRRFAEESARYNVGPVMRNFNLPTTALFFFHPSRVGRFTFTAKGTKTIEGMPALQLDFVEVARPTLIMKRNGTDVPVEGSVWIVPEDGTIVRTRVRLRGFADYVGMAGFDQPRGSSPQPMSRLPAATPTPAPAPAQPASPSPPASGASGGSGSGAQAPAGTPASGAAAVGTQTSTGGEPGANAEHTTHDSFAFPSMVRIDSRADIEVTFRKDPRFGVWLPAKMSEIYEGPLTRGVGAAATGRATAVATYTDYRRFETSATLVAPR